MPRVWRPRARSAPRRSNSRGPETCAEPCSGLGTPGAIATWRDPFSRPFTCGTGRRVSRPLPRWAGPLAGPGRPSTGVTRRLIENRTNESIQSDSVLCYINGTDLRLSTRRPPREQSGRQPSSSGFKKAPQARHIPWELVRRILGLRCCDRDRVSFRRAMAYASPDRPLTA
jgi:hypothetical protein